MKDNQSTVVKSQGASKAVNSNRADSTPVKSKAVKGNSSSKSIVGNKSLQISLDRSDVEKYLSNSHDNSSDNVDVESDTSEDYKTSQKKCEQLK